MFSIFLILSGLAVYGLHSIGLLLPVIDSVVDAFSKNEKFPLGEHKKVEIQKRVLLKRRASFDLIIEFVNESDLSKVTSRAEEIPYNIKITGYKIHNNQKTLFYSQQVSNLGRDGLGMTTYRNEFESDTGNTAVAVKLGYLHLERGEYIFEFLDESSMKNTDLKTFVGVKFSNSK